MVIKPSSTECEKWKLIMINNFDTVTQKYNRGCSDMKEKFEIIKEWIIYIFSLILFPIWCLCFCLDEWWNNND